MANAKTEATCHNCKHKRSVPGDCHIACVKPDPEMRGNRHGVVQGWFFYPINFDPVWMEKKCANFESKEKQDAKTL